MTTPNAANWEPRERNSRPLEEYAMIGDTQTLALVASDGSIDWLCFPRFDSEACFAALLGRPEQGRWRIAPLGTIRRSISAYRDESLVLETELQTAEGTIRIVDAMPIRGRYPDITRLVEGVTGRVRVRSEIALRFEYGRVVPWVRRLDGRYRAIAGPNAVVLASAVVPRREADTLVSEFEVEAGDRVPFVLTWYPSHEATPEGAEACSAIADTDAWWRAWVSGCSYRGPYRDAIVRSLITLKALTYGPTGAIVAAGTTSLPEAIGGMRNWDYRYSWLRDAAFTLNALLRAGYREEARAWRDWLLRAVAGHPSDIQVMYGLAGERHIEERTIGWLDGYEDSRPVRVGNAASGQLQLDIYGEVVEALHQARCQGIEPDPSAWELEREIVEWLAGHWTRPDKGLWELRTRPRKFTHSKVSTWVAMDRAVQAVERFGMRGPADRWRTTRDEIHADVCREGFDDRLGSFTQSYGSQSLDASVLLIPAVGFLPADDPRMTTTIRAIERELMEDGLVLRYRTHEGRNIDGLPGREGAFLACSFWLADAYVLAGRVEEARALFERLLGLRSRPGLLSEEYDLKRKRLIGNLPQAFSHVALVNTGWRLTEALRGPTERETGDHRKEHQP